MKPVRSAIVTALVVCLAGCGQKAHTEPTYVKPEGWDSICLAQVMLDLPKPQSVAEGTLSLEGAYGFPGIRGTGTDIQRVAGMQVLETVPTKFEEFLNLKDLASFHNVDGKIIPYPEAQLKSKLAYGFLSDPVGRFDVGTFDPVDKRIRLIGGGIAVKKSVGTYTAKDVTEQYQKLRSIYTARQPTDIPNEPGICTPYGFFKQPASGPVSDYDINVAVRSLKYPSLIIFVHIRPPQPDGPKTLAELRDPNNITVDDLKSIKGMGAIAAIAALGNIKKLHDPQDVTLAGQQGRLTAREYHHEGTLNTSGSGSGAAYEMQADAVGVAGQPDKPAITIKLAAALPDPYPYPPPVREMVFGTEKITHYKPARPALKGVKTPPFDEAMAYFKQVLASVRPLPPMQAIQQTPYSAPK